MSVQHHGPNGVIELKDFSPSRFAGLDRIGQAFATYDLCPCDDCRSYIVAAVRDYDRL